jgi:hypothetical protein
MRTGKDRVRVEAIQEPVTLGVCGHNQTIGYGAMVMVW